MEHLDRDEVRRLLMAAREHRERDWVALLVAFWHGLRVSELISLTPQNFGGGFLTVQRIKGSRKTTQPLIEHAEEILNERMAISSWIERHPSGRLFPVTRGQLWRLIQLYAKRAGIPPHKAHPHILKHSIAMQMIAESGIQYVRQYLGHKSISSTGAYLEVDDQAASEALARAESRERSEPDLAVQSLGGLTMEETLRRLLRQLEHDKTRKKPKKARF